MHCDVATFVYCRYKIIVKIAKDRHATVTWGLVRKCFP